MYGVAWDVIDDDTFLCEPARFQGEGGQAVLEHCRRNLSVVTDIEAVVLGEVGIELHSDGAAQVDAFVIKLSESLRRARNFGYLPVRQVENF